MVSAQFFVSSFKETRIVLNIRCDNASENKIKTALLFPWHFDNIQPICFYVPDNFELPVNKRADRTDMTAESER